MSRPRTREELIVVTPPEFAARPRGTRARAAAARHDGDELRHIVEANGCQLRPLFGSQRKTPIASLRSRSLGTTDLLDGFYYASGPRPNLDQIAKQLRQGSTPVSAYVRPGAELAELAERAAAPTRTRELSAPEPTGYFGARQKYLGPPPGVDARSAWQTPGALGDGVRIIDIEWGWCFEHEDLKGLRGEGVVGGQDRQNPDHEDHGTAVLGVLGARHNGFGVDGMVPNAAFEAVALQDHLGDPNDASLPLAEAIRFAADRLGPGDIILLEVQVPGPRHGFARRDDSLGYIAPEWWPDVFAAIRYATRREVLVVESAGNGAEDLDDELYDRPAEGFPGFWTNPFQGANTSGAILVAAGTPDNDARMGFSNFGSRIDAQAWGDYVFTTGYGSFVDGGRGRTYYHRFGGTSSAAAIVAGALASVQGVLRHQGKMPLSPEKAAQLLRRSGRSAPGSRIGNRPNVPELIKLASA